MATSANECKVLKNWFREESYRDIISKTHPQNIQCFEKLLLDVGGTYYLLKNIFGNVEKTGEIGEDQKTLISVFEYFLTANAKHSFMEEKLSTGVTPCQNLRLLIFSNFLKFNIK